MKRASLSQKPTPYPATSGPFDLWEENRWFDRRTTWEIRDLGKPLHLFPLPLNDRRTTYLLLDSSRSVRIYGQSIGLRIFSSLLYDKSPSRSTTTTPILVLIPSPPCRDFDFEYDEWVERKNDYSWDQSKILKWTVRPSQVEQNDKSSAKGNPYLHSHGTKSTWSKRIQKWKKSYATPLPMERGHHLQENAPEGIFQPDWESFFSVWSADC